MIHAKHASIYRDTGGWWTVELTVDHVGWTDIVYVYRREHSNALRFAIRMVGL